MMNNVIDSIKLAFRTKNIFCRIFVVLWIVFCALMTLAFLVGTYEGRSASDIFLLLFMYAVFSVVFLMPAASIARGKQASDNNDNHRASDRSWGVTLILALFLGHLGIHRFYVGKKATGIIYIFTMGGFTIGWLTDVILILTGKFTDKHGNIISRAKQVPDYASQPSSSQITHETEQQKRVLTQNAATALRQEAERKNRISANTSSAPYQPAQNSSVKTASSDRQHRGTDLDKKREAWENGGREKLAQWRDGHQKSQSADTVSKTSIFSDVVVSGGEERNQAIPVRSVAAQPSNKLTSSGITVTITTKSTTDDEDLDFDFEDSYSDYSYNGKFIKDMQKYKDKIGNKAPFVPFMQYWPTYDSMDSHQKAWYFYWRNEVRNNRYPDTDLSYIFVHIYELLSGCGWNTANDGYAQLMKLWQAYSDRFPKLDSYLYDWTYDFALLHNLDYLAPEKADIHIPSQLALRDLLIDKHSEDKPLKLPFALIDALCDYSIVGSKFYKDGNQLLMHEAIPRVVALADAALLKKKGKGVLAVYGPNRTRKQSYYAFQSAVCPNANRQVDVSVKAYTSSQKLRGYINELVRYAENVLREINGYRGRLRGVELDTETAALVSGFLKKEYSIKKNTAVTPREKAEVHLDITAIETLRAQSDAVRDALEVLDDPTPATNLLTDLEEITALISMLSGNARTFLYELFAAEWNTTVTSNNKAQADEINRAANQYLARALLVIENNHYIVEDDYRDEVEHIFKTNPEILDHCSEDQNNAESVPASTHVFFDATRLSEELERMVAALTSIQQEALWVIVTQSDPQERLNALSDEAMIMPEMLIDEINDIASQQIDDILIDALDDTLCVLEQYEQELKDAVIAEVI